MHAPNPQPNPQPNNLLNQPLRLFMISALATGLAACGGSSDSDDDSGNDTAYTTLQINAASYEDWVYVDLDTATVLELDATTAAADTSWDIAFRRTEVLLNGGVSGPGSVEGAVGDAQDEFYDDEGNADANVFTNADADIEAEALSAVYDPATLTYVADSYDAAIQDWYIYDFETHTISADTSVGYLVRHADSETYSRVYIEQASYESIELLYLTQAADTTQFAGDEQTLSASFADGQTQLCLDLDTAAEVDCDADWDMMYEVDLSARAINIWTNGGVYGTGSGAAFGAIERTELDDYTSATDVNGYDISNHYAADSSSGVFAEDSWYAYNLTGEHKLWPNFRTYVIDTDSSDDAAVQYSLQISNYYSLGDSGSPEIRFVELVTE